MSEADLQALKGQVALLNNRLLTVDRFSFDANKKVNTELEKDGVRLNRHRSCLNTLQDKHNALVSFVRGHLSQLELHCRGLLSLRDKMCSCAAPESPIDGSGEAPSFSAPSTPRGGSPAVEVESEDPVVVPPENEIPVPIPAPVPIIPAPTPRRTVVESTSTLHPISEEEARAIEDRLVGAWQRQGADNAIPTIQDGLELNKTFSRSCSGRVVELTREQMGIWSPEARGYQMLSVMRAVTMMPNSTVSARLLSSDFVGGELQLVFPILQEEFDSLVSGKMEVEVRPVVTAEVVRGGVEDDELKTVVESTSTLHPISEEEARAIEDRLVGAWQRQGADNAIPTIQDGLELNKTFSRSCSGRVVELTREQMGIWSPEARGYQMLSVMRAVTMMPNSTVSARLLSSDFVGGELQLVFPILQEEFDSLVSGKMEVEVRPVVTAEVVRGGVEDDELKYE
ncbi:hypothetical protein BDM02DRAFT_3193910 [Thelephora ganbajun]|uniref:Uncharacterized protein n=1 Tax=Thelephora ganbajun TaxID=370292 RepID=A0ACB6YXU9_THEGA|nr:hypothetical protein BDM02DRAFT_3193910 [Thelephora ganbajun]